MALGLSRALRTLVLSLTTAGTAGLVACAPHIDFADDGGEGGVDNAPVTTGGSDQPAETGGTAGTTEQPSTGGDATAGNGGGGGVPSTCRSNRDCSSFAATTVCDTDTGNCVECLPDDDTCESGTYCTIDLECQVGCTDDGDCVGLTCNTDTNECEGCTADEECPRGTICVDASCTAGCVESDTCPNDWECCGGQCTNLLTDEAHCSACDAACELERATPICRNGGCEVDACDEGWNDCDENPANGCESDPLSDAFNCGECGSPCRTGQACIDGSCGAPTCGTDFDDCNGLPDDGCETNLRSSINHCGACFAACSTVHGTAECRNSQCSIVCDTSWGSCDGSADNGCETNLERALAHCGACDHACVNDHGSTVCLSGQCAPTCAPGFTSCDGDPATGCETNLDADVDHCGGCGQACQLPHATPSCEAGACAVAECLNGWVDCDGDPTNGCEVNPDSDPTHCGGCGQACSDNNGTPSCIAGVCDISCSAGFEDCDGELANGCEVALGTASATAVGDVANCGACGTVCPSPGGETPNCVGGVCGISDCPDGRADCDGDASNGCEVNTETDADNCGRCGGGCDAANGTAACLAGVCVVASCEPNFDDCDGTYDNGCEQSLRTTAHCGACDSTCAPTNAVGSCGTGTCEVSSCTGPYADCNGNAGDGCEINTDTNAANCGACTNTCDATHGSPFCDGGICGITCDADWGNCDANAGTGCETSLIGNDVHCGACGNGCTASHGSASCSGVTCMVSGCTSPWGDCNNSYGDGCETNTSGDVAHCGACDSACSTNHGTPSCSVGQCSITCSGDWRNCDSNVANGCETDTSTAMLHCGSCNAPCDYENASESCRAGLCSLDACDPGFGNCDFSNGNGCEANFATDPLHCSACNAACDLPHTVEGCNAGACTIASCVTNYDNCDGSTANGCEADLRSDEENCGACGTACFAANGTVQCLNRNCTITSCTAPWENCDGNYDNGCETNTNTNRNHCGVCGNACPTSGGNWICVGGSCEVSSCVLPDADCDGNAGNGCETNTNTSEQHCGGCDSPCAPPNATGLCSAGDCTVSGCIGDFEDCDGAVSNGCEIDTSSNVSHCGACSSPCNLPHATESCIASTCTISSCDGSWFDCDGSDANGCERDLANDPLNCGTCGNVCDSTNGTATCVDSVCGIVCSPGYANCDGNVGNGCEANLATTNTCGSCANTCTTANGTPACSGSPASCQIGSCTAPFDDCNSSSGDGCETNTNININHCGACNNVCNSINGTAQCNLGSCSIVCTAPYDDCNGVGSDGCETNTNFNLQHCGGCNQGCSFANANANCNTGACTMGACLTNFENCDGSATNGCEVNTTTSTAHCGGCNQACTNDHGGTSCVGSACNPTCTNVANNRWGNCDGNARNGCETNLLDPFSCGSCTTVCSYPNGIADCVESGGARCALAGCTNNHDNCDGNDANGCEQDVSSDLANCGACDYVCGTGHADPQCVSGGCVLNCDAGYNSCDTLDSTGCETHTDSDPLHCGACNNACDPETAPYCIQGTCSAFDNIALVSVSSDGTAGSALSFTHYLETGPGNNRLVVVGVAARGNDAPGAQPSSVSFGGTEMLFVRGDYSNNQAWSGLYYLTDELLPTTAPLDYSLDIAGSESAVLAYLAELTGVDQGTPIQASAGGAFNQCYSDFPTVSISVATQGWALDVLAGWGGATTGTEGPGQVSLDEQAANGVSLWGSRKGPVAGPSTTMTWSGDCSQSAHSVLSLNRGML